MICFSRSFKTEKFLQTMLKRRSISYELDTRKDAEYFLDLIAERGFKHSDIKGFESDRLEIDQEGFNPTPKVYIQDKDSNHLGYIYVERHNHPQIDIYHMAIGNNTNADQLLDITEKLRRKHIKKRESTNPP